MTIAGLVARTHSVSGFDDPAGFYTRAGIAAGGVFSAFVEVRVESVESRSTDEQYIGNLDGSGGFAISRASSSLCAFNFSVLDLTLTVELEPSTALGRTFLLGMSSSGTLVTAWVDGVQVASGESTAGAGTGDFAIGGDPDSARNAATDSLIFSGYSTSVLTASEWAALWNSARVYAKPTTGLSYTWRALTLYPADGTASPATWVNEGTTGAAGDLTLGGSPTLTFIDDPNPMYTGLISPQDVVNSALDIFVSGGTGDDANDGLTPSTAVATMAGAWSKVPLELAASVIFHTTGTVPWSALPSFLQRNKDTQIIVYGDGAGQLGDDGFTVVATGIAAAGTTAISIVPTVAVVVDAYQFYTIEMTSGAFVGERRTVRNNLAASIVPVYGFSGDPAPGDTFRILTPKTVFSIGSDTTICAGLGRSVQTPVTFINVDFSGSGQYLAMTSSNVRTFGVRFTNCIPDYNEGYLCSGTTSAFMGAFSAALWAVLGLSDKDSAWVGWGASAIGSWAPVGAEQPDTGLFAGFLAVSGGITVYGGRLELGGGFTTSFYMDYYTSSLLFQYPFNATAGFLIRGYFTQYSGTVYAYDNLIVEATNVGYNLSDGGHVEIYVASRPNWMTSTNTGVVVSGGSLAIWADGASTITAGSGPALKASNAEVHLRGTINFVNSGSGSTLWISSARASCISGTISAVNSGSGLALQVSGGGDFDLDGSTLSVTSASTDGAAIVEDQGSLATSYSTFSITASGSTSSGCTVRTGGKLSIGSAGPAGASTIVGGALGLDIGSGGSVSTFRDLSCTASTAGGTGIRCLQGSMSISGNLSAAATGANSRGLVCTGSSINVFGNITATATLANSIGLLCSAASSVSSSDGTITASGVTAGAQVTSTSRLRALTLNLTATAGTGLICTLNSDVSATTSTISGTTFGVNCRGGGRVVFTNVPTVSATVATDQLTVGTAGGQTNSVALALPAALSVLANAGGSTIQRVS